MSSCQPTRKNEINLKIRFAAMKNHDSKVMCRLNINLLIDSIF